MRNYKADCFDLLHYFLFYSHRCNRLEKSMRDQLDEYRELFAAGSKAEAGTGTGRGSSRTYRYSHFKYNDQII